MLKCIRYSQENIICTLIKLFQSRAMPPTLLHDGMIKVLGNPSLLIIGFIRVAARFISHKNRMLGFSILTGDNVIS